jgi:hypothetical protein
MRLDLVKVNKLQIASLVRLTEEEKFTVRQIYDREQQQDAKSVTGNLAAYIVLLHLCRPMALGNDSPIVEAAPWTVWHYAGVTLHSFLKRDGGSGDLSQARHPISCGGVTLAMSAQRGKANLRTARVQVRTYHPKRKWIVLGTY